MQKPVLLRRARHPAGLVALLAVTLLLDRAGCDARSLRDALDDLTTFTDVTVPSNVSRAAVAIQRNAVRASDFVTTATAPGFFYRFDLELGAAERVSFSGGAVYVEPAYTIGARHLDLALSYQYVDFTDLDDEPLADTLDDLQTFGARTIFNIRASEFSLRYHVFTGSVTWGLTDRWDVNLLVPVVVTALDLHGESELFVDFSLFGRKRVDVSEERAGVGDVLLRTKYRLLDFGGVHLASVLALRTPTGEEADFQGLGDTIVTPLLAATRSLGRCDLHANAGFDFNADDVERDRVRYGVGGTCGLTAALTVVGGVIGSSGLQADEFTERAASSEIERTDVVDGFAAVKVALPGNLLVHVGAIVPATRDGLRADVVPAGGIEKVW